MNSARPLVSIIMPVYNSEKYLRESIYSILNQTLKNLELIIIDDRSSDDSIEIIHSFIKKDNRIKLYINKENKGAASSRNLGISYSKGKYIALMDSDDISYSNRLEKQVIYLEENHDIGLCGSNCTYIGFKRNHKSNLPLNHDEILSSFLFYNPVVHPSITFRASILKKMPYVYQEGKQRVEDLELLVRMSKNVKLANLPDELIKYRTFNPDKQKKHKSVIAYGNKIRISLLESFFNSSVDKNDFLLHMKIAKCQRNNSEQFIRKTEKWLLTLYKTNTQKNTYEQKSFNKVLGYYWYKVCRSSCELGITAISMYIKSPLQKFHKISFYSKTLFLLAAALHKKRSQININTPELEYYGTIADNE